MAWLRSKGARFILNHGRQSGMVNGKRVYFGNMPIEVNGGGAGLVQYLDAAAKKAGIEIFYDTRATSLIYDGERVSGVRAKHKGKNAEFHAKSVVLACGGFEANPEMRTRYLGPGWELAKVRGSRFNVGDGLKMALDIGAAPYGNWSGCHATGWDRYAPEFGDVNVGDQFQKHSYIFGLLINSDGKRFVDEGWDFHSFTYAKYGGEVLKQPGQFAWQVFDSKVKHLLRSEYRIKFMTKVSANTLEELAPKLEGVNAAQFPEDRARIQRRGEEGRAVRSHGQGRQGHRRHRAAEIELGAAARHAAVRRLRHDLRHHLHLRRAAHRQGNRPGARRQLPSRSPASTPRARWSADCSTSTTRAAPASSPARCSAAWPAPPPARPRKPRRKAAKPQRRSNIRSQNEFGNMQLIQLFLFPLRLCAFASKE